MTLDRAGMFVVAALALLVGAGEAAGACCSCGIRLFTSGFDTAVETPGCEAFDCGAAVTSVTDDLVGSFWILGEGNPTPNLGVDNGTFPALGGWLQVFPDYPGYGAYIQSTWVADARIDGCPDYAGDPRRCMGLALFDVSPDSVDGVFALLTDLPDNIGNYDFSQPGNITLAAIPRPVITRSVATSQGSLVTVLGPTLTDLQAGLYLHPDCEYFGPQMSDHEVRGFRVYGRQEPAGSPAPEQRAVADWTPLTEVLPLGEEAQVSVDCAAGAADQWLAIGLALDRLYESAFVSSPSSRIACGPNFVDPDDIDDQEPRPRRVLRWPSIQR